MGKTHGFAGDPKYAFSNCDNLVSVFIPESMKTIGGSAFSNCDNLTAVNISSLLSWCNLAFANSSANPLSCAKSLYLNGELLTELVVPEGVTEISDYLFSCCTSLTSVTIPEGVTNIGVLSFKDCIGLTTLIIGPDVKRFGGQVGRRANPFKGCVALESLTVMGGVMPDIESGWDKIRIIRLFSPTPLKTSKFAEDVYNDAVLYVPEGSLELYQTAEIWKEFKNIQEFDTTGIDNVVTDGCEAPIYNMKGVRMNCTKKALPAGMYVQDGTKFVVM